MTRDAGDFPMWRTCLRICLAGCALVLIAGPAWAQDSRVEILERQLAERDKVMLELLHRIETLEKRVGVQRVARDTPRVPDAPDAPKTEIANDLRQAPGAVVVSASAAERALERSLSREGALLLPRGVLEIEPGVSFARREDATPSFVISDGGVVAAETERNADRFSANLTARLGLPWDSQLEIGLPYELRQVESATNVGFAPAGATTRSGDGLGDLRIGLAKTLLREGLWRPDVVGRVTWDTNTGRGSNNGVSLGGSFHEVRGSLTAIKRQDPVVFIGGLSYQHTFERGQIQPGEVYSLSLGGAFALSPETSLRLFLSTAFRGETKFLGSQVDGSDQTIASLVIGGATLLAPGILLNASLGFGLTDDAEDVSLMFSIPIRFNAPLF